MKCFYTYNRAKWFQHEFQGILGSKFKNTFLENLKSFARA